MYALDFSLSPSVMQWRVISGGAGTLLNSTSQTPAVSSMFAVQSVNQWWLQLPTVSLLALCATQLCATQLLPHTYP